MDKVIITELEYRDLLQSRIQLMFIENSWDRFRDSLEGRFRPTKENKEYIEREITANLIKGE